MSDQALYTMMDTAKKASRLQALKDALAAARKPMPPAVYDPKKFAVDMIVDRIQRLIDKEK